MGMCIAKALDDGYTVAAAAAGDVQDMRAADVAVVPSAAVLPAASADTARAQCLLHLHV